MTVNIAFVGTGGIANHHMRTLAEIDCAEMVGFFDLDIARAEATAAAFGGNAYPSLEALCDGSSPDAVYVCLPPFAHGEIETELARRKLPMFVEKPVAVDMGSGRRVLDAVQDSGVITAVGYHWRYMDNTERAQELVGNDPVGFALGGWMGGMPGVAWWRVRAQGGGQIVEQTTHIVDLARHLMGEVVQVHATARTGLMAEVENYDIHDATVTNFVFASGAIASLTSTCLLSAGGQVGLDLYQRGRVVRLRAHELIVEESTGTQTHLLGNNPTRAEDEAFVHAVATGDSSAIRSDYADALRTLEVTLAATESADEGRVIELA